MKKSRYDYIHFNKGGITVGIKGTEKQSFSYDRIYSAIENVQQKAVDYTMRFTKNAKFPRELGMSGQYSVILNDFPDILYDLQRGKIKEKSQDFLNRIQDVLKLEEKNNFEKRYAELVNQYYGTNLSKKKTFQALKKGNFKVNPHDLTINTPQSDPITLIEWLVTKTDYSQEVIDEASSSIYKLAKLAQDWELKIK